MLNDDDIRQIKKACRIKLGSSFERLNPPDNSEQLSHVIADAIAAAIKEYDQLKNR